MANAKHNWSKSEPSMRKPHAAPMTKRPKHSKVDDLVVTLDWALVSSAFKSKVDPNREQF